MTEDISIRVLISRILFNLLLICIKDNGPSLNSGRYQCRDWFSLTENMLKRLVTEKNSKISTQKVLIELFDTEYDGQSLFI